jgi:hypothetical protein
MKSEISVTDKVNKINKLSGWNMEYKVIRKEVKTGRIFETICNQMQVDNITEYPMSLYSLESITQIADQTIETKKAGRPSTGNNANELYKIIRRGKRDIKEYIEAGTDRTLIYNWYELIKKDCQKYSEANTTCRQMYFNFLQWWNKYDKLLYPEYH